MRTCIAILILISIQHYMIGQKIEPIGSGLTMNGTIYDIAMDKQSDKTYVVGDFSAIDGIKMEKVGLLENGEWKALPDISKIDGVIFCAEVVQGVLYVGGNFTISSDEEIKNLAKFENGSWQSLGIEIMSGSIRAMAGFDGELYVTGDFRSINGINHNGVIKYSNHQWQDAGLNSHLNSQGLFASGDTLFAWGNGFSTHDGHSHTVSFYTNNKWNTLPNYDNTPSSISTSSIKYKGDIYSTNANRLFRYDFNSNSWILINTLSGVDGKTAILFEHQDDLHLIFDSRFYRLTNGELELLEFQTVNQYYFGDVKVVKSVNDELVVGGNFHHWNSHSVSLSSVAGDNITSLGKVSSNITYKGPFQYSIGESIVRYNNQILIAGSFRFADDLYSPNIVYWDGENFSPFETPLPTRIRQMEVFENVLYATVVSSFNGYKLIKYDGTQWIGVDTPVNANNIKGINIINDKLFLQGNFRINSYFDDDGGPHYLQGNSWHELQPFTIDEKFYSYTYGNIQPYKEGYLMTVEHWPTDQIVYLPSDTSEWEVLDNIDVHFDQLVTVNDNIFIFGRWPRAIYRVYDGVIDTVARNLETDYPVFFTIDDRIYFSAWSESLYRLDNNFKFELYNQLRVRDIEKIDDERYLLALQTNRVDLGLERTVLNNLGILTFEPLNASIEQDRHTTCPKKYVQFWPKTDHINLNYQWDFEEGIPSKSNAVFPMVKYDAPGTYTASLKASNLDGDTLYQSVEIIVDDCYVPEPRASNFDNHYIMGYEYWNGRGLGGFDFTFPDTVMAPRYLSPVELHNGTTVMSDHYGNLQFYSNGISIMNRDNEPMVGSECFNADLIGYSLDYFISNQSLLSLPAVENDSLYYLFDLDLDFSVGEYWGAASNLSVTTIDMRRNNGKGEVVNCNELIIDDILLKSTMQACRHKNGKDWWIVVGKYQSDEYYKILLTKNGIESVERANWGNFYSTTFSGQSTFSPNGEYFAQVIRENQEVSIWKFDNQTGLLSDQQVYTIVPLDEYEYPQGCSFSPNSRFLYVSSRSQLRQIDLCNYDELEVELIDSWNGTYEFIYPLFFGKQMLAPNQQILITPTGNSHRSFGVIESPNEKGINCNFKQHSLQIAEICRNSADVIPVFPHFRNYPSYEGDCEGVNTVSPHIEDSFFVYPNPVGPNTLLRFSRKTTGDLYSVNGQKIFSFSNSDYLDTNTLAPGVYIIKTKIGTQKFVKL